MDHRGTNFTEGYKSMEKQKCSVLGCESDSKWKGMCGKHSTRVFRHGDPLKTGTPARGVPVEERFWTNVDKSGECWTWSGDRDAKGYGTVYIASRKKDRCHRVSWRLTFGEIPEGLFVCHKCDNPPCCRPGHLFLGTPKDNAIDMAEKGRAAISKISPQQAKEILSKYTGSRGEQRRLASEYGVSQPTIWRIVNRTHRLSLRENKESRVNEELEAIEYGPDCNELHGRI
jgi:HNH endonuclease